MVWNSEFWNALHFTGLFGKKSHFCCFWCDSLIIWLGKYFSGVPAVNHVQIKHTKCVFLHHKLSYFPQASWNVRMVLSMLFFPVWLAVWWYSMPCRPHHMMHMDRNLQQIKQTLFYLECHCKINTYGLLKKDFRFARSTKQYFWRTNHIPSVGLCWHLPVS